MEIEQLVPQVLQSAGVWTTQNIIAQAIGFIAAAFIIASFQFKDAKNMFRIQLISGLLFSVQFLLLGAFSGMVQNLVGMVFRLLLLYNEKHKWAQNKIFLILIVICSAGLSVMSMVVLKESWLSLLPALGNIVGMCSLWTKKANLIKYIQLGLCSPLWLIYNIFSNSIFGTITEVFNMVSIIVFFIRIGKKPKKQKRSV